MEKNLADFSDDSYLLEEIKRGNEEAFVYLFKNYFPRLRGYAIRFIEDEEIVRDIIQECFLKFWEKRDLLSSVSITSLLFAMVRNGCLNYLKHVSIVEKHRIELLMGKNGFTIPTSPLMQTINSSMTNCRSKSNSSSVSCLTVVAKSSC